MGRVLKVAAAAVAIGLASCASSNSLLVDRMGVDDARYDRDLAACKQQSPPMSLSMSNPIATCMTAKGYKVLMGR